MRLEWKIGAAVGLGVGFFLGVLVAGSFHRRAEDAGSTAESSRRGIAETPLENADRASNRPARKKVGEDRTAGLAAQRISIPLEEIAKILKANARQAVVFSPGNAGYDQKKVEEALLLLGATQAEREEILGIFDRSAEEIRKAETAHLRLSKVTPTEIELDTTQLRAPVAEILDRMKNQLGTALPDARGEALVNSVPWDLAYPTQRRWTDSPDAPPEPYHLKIVRYNEECLLGACGTSCSWNASPIPEKFKDNGEPIPVSEIFGEAMKPFTQGVSLLPIDKD